MLQEHNNSQAAKWARSGMTSKSVMLFPQPYLLINWGRRDLKGIS